MMRLTKCHLARNRKSAVSKAIVRLVEKSLMMKSTAQFSTTLDTSSPLHTTVRCMDA